MTLTLDPGTAALIQRELDRGRFESADDLIRYALYLVETEDSESHRAFTEDWLLRNRDAIRNGLEESCASRDRGEGYSPEETLAYLAQRREARQKAGSIENSTENL